MSTLNEGTLAAQPAPGAPSESGTNQTTGSEPSTSGASNDGTTAAITRAESFLHALLTKLESWLHIGDVAGAKADAENALAHLAEGKTMAATGETVAAIADVAQAVDDAATGKTEGAGTAETPAQ